VDSTEQARALQRRLRGQPGFDFPLLSDPDYRVINRYGLLNPRERKPMAYPATLVIDRAGIVRWRVVEIDYRVRPSNADVLREVAKIEAGR
jgi:peroxiredoxin